MSEDEVLRSEATKQRRRGDVRSGAKEVCEAGDVFGKLLRSTPYEIDCLGIEIASERRKPERVRKTLGGTHAQMVKRCWEAK